MAVVADLERFLERVFERPAARVFRSRLQAVQVQRQLERAMEAGRAGKGTATVVPNRFRVRVNPADLDDLAVRNDSLDVLAATLAEQALAFARSHGYHLASRPLVLIEADPVVDRRTVEVDASVWRPAPAGRAAGVVAAVPVPPSTGDGMLAFASIGPDPAAAPVSADAGAPVASDGADDPDALDRLVRLARPATDPATQPSPPAGAGSLRAAADRRYAVRPPAPPAVRALLRVLEPGDREHEVRIADEPLTLGRATDNGLVIADSRVSRHHGRFQSRHGTLVYTDLASTNGSRVNGIRVDEIVLGPGDRLQVGDAVIVVEQLPR